MADFTFFDAGFTATQIGVKPVSTEAKVLFEDWFGKAAVSSILRKSGGYDMMAKVSSLGLIYEVLEQEMPLN